MARVGMNPARKKITEYRPAEVTAAVVTYVPHLEGYFKSRLEILKLTLLSLKEHTTVPYDLLVFDNGSCAPAINFLQNLFDNQVIDYLFLSGRNVGVEGALKFISRAAPGKYLAYSNDDVFFYPGWLKEHLRIMNTFPRVGMVSGSPAGFSSESADQALQRFIHENENGDQVLEFTRRVRDVVWEKDWARSTGRDVEQHLRNIQEKPHDVVTYRGVEAISGAKHFQFVASKELVQQALPEEWHGNLMGGVVELDHRVDSMGRLRLTTAHRLTRHIGNIMDDSIRAEAKNLGLEVEKKLHGKKKQHWLLNVPGMGRILRRVYHWLFEILHGSGS
mgnify:CR=1 FL=1